MADEHVAHQLGGRDVAVGREEDLRRAVRWCGSRPGSIGVDDESDAPVGHVGCDDKVLRVGARQFGGVAGLGLTEGSAGGDMADVDVVAGAHLGKDKGRVELLRGRAEGAQDVGQAGIARIGPVVLLRVQRDRGQALVVDTDDAVAGQVVAFLAVVDHHIDVVARTQRGDRGRHRRGQRRRRTPVGGEVEHQVLAGPRRHRNLVDCRRKQLIGVADHLGPDGLACDTGALNTDRADGSVEHEDVGADDLDGGVRPGEDVARQIPDDGAADHVVDVAVERDVWSVAGSARGCA